MINLEEENKKLKNILKRLCEGTLHLEIAQNRRVCEDAAYGTEEKSKIDFKSKGIEGFRKEND